MRLLKADKYLVVLLILIFALSQECACAQDENAPELKRAIERLKDARIPNAQVGISVVDLSSGKQLVDLDSDKLLKPASVLKLVISAVALSELGPNYRYRTELVGERIHDGLAGTIAIHGVGAPDMVVESVWLLARRLRNMGVQQIERLVIDQSSFAAPRQAVGQRAYQTGAAAMSFNHNSIAVVICPTKVGKAATLRVDPWESGATVSGRINTIAGGASSYSIDQDSNAADGSLRFVARGSISTESDCKSVYRSVDDPGAYFLSTAHKLFESVGIRVGRVGEVTAIPSGYLPITSVESKPLSEIITDLNHFSNNFIAEQVLHTLGEQSNGVYSRSFGLDRISKWLVGQGIGADQFLMADASGLSHDSRATARLFTTILRLMAANQRVGPEFISSLSISNESGTLKERHFGSTGEELFVRAKTGTLDGVSSLAGYVQTVKGRNMAFAILLNQVSSKERAVDFEDQVVGLIFKQ